MSPSLAKPILLVLALATAGSLGLAYKEFGLQRSQRQSLEAASTELAAVNARLAKMDKNALAHVAPVVALSALVSQLPAQLAEVANRYSIQLEPGALRASPRREQLPGEFASEAATATFTISGSYLAYPQLLQFVEELGKRSGSVTRLKVVGTRFELDYLVVGLQKAEAGKS